MGLFSKQPSLASQGIIDTATPLGKICNKNYKRVPLPASPSSFCMETLAGLKCTSSLLARLSLQPFVFILLARSNQAALPPSHVEM